MPKELNLILLFLLVSNFCFSSEQEESRSVHTTETVLPVVLDAIDNLLLSKKSNDLAIAKAQEILLRSGVDIKYLKKIRDKLYLKKSLISSWPLPNNEVIIPDIIEIINSGRNSGNNDNRCSSNRGSSTSDNMICSSFPIALHVFKIDIINSEDDLFGDNLYCYFFVTDGVVPSGKVTSIYKSSNGGDSLFLDNEDRVVYPLVFPRSEVYRQGRVINKQLIVDFGIVESDGDQIDNLQKISSSIIGLATAVYAITHPGTTRSMEALRREIKILSDALLKLDSDDRLVTDTIILPAEKVPALFTNDSNILEFVKRYQGVHNGSEWEYLLHFRILKYGSPF